ncbi:hypothetical protein Poli38472_012125 [Pythium oligandrum]|uniref:Uncharacterized protein n=1 Tax=Pythium oligandrum TaxID=41045 RepID=A0A8K1CPS8_PYTOL|nr:hypothetical protein Poli38472_012125 [Pythium oligandrum]|eukprot:TMW67009.1 hypothetical protein Poli38472_012125 [Pythium oligandrum]
MASSLLPGQIECDDDERSSKPATSPSRAFRLLQTDATTTTINLPPLPSVPSPAVSASSSRVQPEEPPDKSRVTSPPSGSGGRRGDRKSSAKVHPPVATADAPPVVEEKEKEDPEARTRSQGKKKKKKSSAPNAMDLTIAAIDEEEHGENGASTASLPVTQALTEGSAPASVTGESAAHTSEVAWNAPDPSKNAGPVSTTTTMTTPVPPPSAAAPAPYRRQTMMKSGGSSWRQKGHKPTIILETADSSTIGASDESTQADSNDELTFKLPELTTDDEKEIESGAKRRLVKETWPMDHVKLLYMLSRYAVCARSRDEKETWIRQIPLLVLMYEGIAAGALNFDYAPAAMVIAQEGKPKRIWINATQDGKSAIDDLREASLINGLKVSTKDYHSVTAFQVSLRGLCLLQQISKDLKASVDAFIVAPKPYRRELLTIRYIPIEDPPDMDLLGVATDSSVPSWSFQGSDKQLTTSSTTSPTKEEPGFNDEGRFVLESVGYYRYSEVTETEDVSYVSSPFVPQCVRSPDAFQTLSSNAHRAHEAAGGQSNIRDTLSEAIVLAHPVCIIGEWIPFGSNQVVALNERLGSMDRCQGGLFTSLIDDKPTETQFEVPPGLTQVRILDYDPVRFINFEAEINFPEDDGIVQVENFGIHLNVDGTIFYGIQVDSILDKRADRISVDLLSRLLVDMHQDSSEVMDDLLSSYQSSLLDMIFLGDIGNRGKFNMIMAEQIDPFMPGLEYMDRGDYENELKQVLGDIHCAYDIGDDSVMIVGRDGMLVAGSAAKRFEKVFIAYFSLLCREMFLRSFFTRIFVLEELLKHVRQLIFKAKEDPTHLTTIRSKLTQATNDLILFTDTLGYLLESLEFVKIPHKSPHPSVEEEEIFGYLDLKKQHHDILLRARDLEKLVHGAKYEVVNLRQMADVLNTSQLEDIFLTVESNTKTLADASLIAKQSGSSLDLVQVLLAGSFAFTVLDRLPGGTLNMEAPKWVLDAFYEPIIKIPLLFFVLNLIWMSLFIAIVVWYKHRRRQNREIGRRTLRMKVHKAINVGHLEAYLATKELTQQESVCQTATEVRRVVWNDVQDMIVKPSANKAEMLKARKAARPKYVRLFAWLKYQKVLLIHAWNAAAAVTSGQPTPPKPQFDEDNFPLPQLGPPVQVEAEYDSRHGFLLFVTFHFRVTEPKLPKVVEPGKEPLWQKLLQEFIRRMVEAQETAVRRPNRKMAQVASTTPSDASPETTPGPATKNMGTTEEELMSWFAWTLKNNKVITDVDAFLAT